MRARDSILFLAGCALTAGAAAWFFLRDRAPAPAPPPAAHVEDETEPDPPSHRVAIAPLVIERPTAPAATVDQRWAKMNREAIDFLEKGDAERAVGLFDQCWAAVPSEKIFAANLAEALARLSLVEYERGGEKDRQAAIDHLARAAELAPSRADIKHRLEQLQRLTKSEKGMWTESSEHFELAYDGERSDLIWSSYEITQVLESAYQEFGDLFGRLPVESGRSKIRVVIYRKQLFHDATGIGHWAGGLYDGAIRVPLENLRGEKHELERVLRHEIAHAFVAECGGKSVPGWLNEGLAQWLESSTMITQSREVEAARKMLKGKSLLPLERVQKNLGELKDAQEINLAYAQSLALTAFIEHSFGDRLLYEMVAGCKTSKPCETTFKKRTGVELTQTLADLASGL
jgi:tetratricopeptide (TPR) repeat protein